MFFNFLKYKNFYFAFSGSLILLSLFALFFWNLKLGIEFTGGSILEVEFLKEAFNQNQVKEALEKAGLRDFSLQKKDEKTLTIVVLKTQESLKEKIISAVGGSEKVKELKFEVVGATISKELREKTILLTLLSIFLILLYIVFAFRKVSYPVKPFVYGLAAILALCHDLLITLGTMAALGHFLNVPLTIPIVVAFLTIAGYSINDTIVIFDRIRENLLWQRNQSFEKIIDLSLNQTLSRSVNTYLTTIFVLVAIFLFGGESLKYFSLILIVGIFMGAYSSIFLAAPLLILLSGIEFKKAFNFLKLAKRIFLR
jgi:preprotein translocase subunit SecF